MDPVPRALFLSSTALDFCERILLNFLTSQGGAK